MQPLLGSVLYHPDIGGLHASIVEPFPHEFEEPSLGVLDATGYLRLPPEDRQEPIKGQSHLVRMGCR